MQLITSCFETVKPIFAYALQVGAPLTMVTPECDCCKACNIPALRDGDLTIRFQGPIMRYIARKFPEQNLLGMGFQQEAIVDQFLTVAENLNNDIFKYIMPVICPDCKTIAVQGNQKAMRECIFSRLTCLNERLTENSFIAGPRMTIADFALFSGVSKAMKFMLGEKERATFPALCRFFNHMLSLEAFKIFYPEFPFAIAPIPDCPKKEKAEKAEKAEKTEKAKKVEKVEKVIEKTEEKPKEEKPKEEKKAKPALPSCGKLDIEGWKRYYKNLDWDNAPCEWASKFKEMCKVDEDMSFWLCEYIYPEQLLEDWKSNNLVNIWLQRLRGEKADRYTFGNIGVYKNDNESHFRIVGVFIFPAGDKAPEAITECSGSQSYNFTKIENWEEKETFDFINGIWSWNEDAVLTYKGKTYGKYVDGSIWH